MKPIYIGKKKLTPKQKIMFEAAIKRAQEKLLLTNIVVLWTVKPLKDHDAEIECQFSRYLATISFNSTCLKTDQDELNFLAIHELVHYITFPVWEIYHDETKNKKHQKKIIEKWDKTMEPSVLHLEHIINTLLEEQE